MTAAIATPISQIELTPGSAIRINGVTWEGYIALLKELGDDRSTRIAYDNEVLEIRMPGQLHEAANRVLATIALTLAEEFGFEFNDLGSMTMNRPDLTKGIEVVKQPKKIPGNIRIPRLGQIQTYEILPLKGTARAH